MVVSKEIQLDYGHTLPNHFSFCNQIHGHRARVVAYVEGEVSPLGGDSSQGMVVDFKFLKAVMMEKVHDVLDHGFAVWEGDTEEIKALGGFAGEEVSTLDFIRARNRKVLVTTDPPTAETLAKWAFDQIKPTIPFGLTLVRVEWWETPSSCAIYELVKKSQFDPRAKIGD